MESFDLAAIQQRRKEALNQGKNWTLTANELYSAWRLGEEEFQCVEFVGADLQYANFRGSDFQGSDFRGANFGRANLRNTNFWRANLRGANLEGAKLEGANFRSANLEGANLRDARLENASLEMASLENADLWNAKLQGANLWGANLVGANLQDADLRLTNLAAANLKRANITNARAALGSIRVLDMSSDNDTLDAGINARGELIFWSEFQRYAITPTELRAGIAQKYGDSVAGKLYLMAIAMFEMAFAERQRLSDLGG